MTNTKSAEEIVRGATAAEKSLRWLANNFPDDGGEDETSKLSRCIHLYCKSGADSIDALMAQLTASQQETRAAVESWSGFCSKCNWRDKQRLSDGQPDARCVTCRANNKCNWQWRGPQEAGEECRG